MNSGTAANPVKIILDTNILISAIGFGGKPRQVFILTLLKKVKAVSSPILLAELEEVVNKKFPNLEYQLNRILRKIKKTFILVSPKTTLSITKDEDDNRVLEAAVEGKCSFIVTGDKELLELRSYDGVKILTADQFLKLLELQQIKT